jgi:hypothetical protein
LSMTRRAVPISRPRSTVLSGKRSLFQPMRIRAEKTVTLDGQVAEYRQQEIVATQVGVA